MKIYKRKLLEDVLPRLLVKQFAFDIEILAVAYHLGYTRVFEAPVEIDLFSTKSSIQWSKMYHVVYNMVNDTLAVFTVSAFFITMIDTSKRKWRFDPELNFRIKHRLIYEYSYPQLARCPSSEIRRCRVGNNGACKRWYVAAIQ